METVRVKKLRQQAKLPTYGSAQAAGADLHACLEEPITIEPGETVFIPTGIALEIPEHHAGLVYARSSLGTRRGLAPANKVGVIDSDYRGEVFVVLYNHGKTAQTIAHGERIAQLVITPVLQPAFVEADVLEQTHRGEGGFGSTGR